MMDVITIDIWKIFQTRVEWELAKKAKIDKQGTTICELQEFFAIELLIAATFANNYRELRNHFSDLKTNFGFKMGVNRRTTLKGALVLTNEEIEKICDILHVNFLKLVTSGG